MSACSATVPGSEPQICRFQLPAGVTLGAARDGSSRLVLATHEIQTEFSAASSISFCGHLSINKGMGFSLSPFFWYGIWEVSQWVGEFTVYACMHMYLKKKKKIRVPDLMELTG